MHDKDTNYFFRSLGWALFLVGYLIIEYDLDIAHYYLLAIALFTSIYAYGDHFSRQLMAMGVKSKYFNSYKVGLIVRRIILTASLPLTFGIVIFVVIKGKGVADTATTINALTLFALAITFFGISDRDDLPRDSN